MGSTTPSAVQLVECASCGATNRVPEPKLQQGLQPLCGRCKEPLPIAAGPAEPVTLTDATFAVEIEESSIPVVVDMWAPWCGPCEVMDELAAEMAGRVRFAKLNVDENPSTAARFDIKSLPALLIFKDGRELDRIVGVQPKTEIVRRLEALAA